VRFSVQERTRKYKLKRLFVLTLLLLVFAVGTACAQITLRADMYPVERSGWYSTKEQVAVYLATYGELPENYLTKREARSLGWNGNGKTLWYYADGCSIGGDHYGNYEGNVPEAFGREWTECDIDFDGKKRGKKRIVFSNDGLIYYTEDHYESFEEIVVVGPGDTSGAKPDKTSEPDKTPGPEKTPAPEKASAVTTDRQPEYGKSYTAWEDVAAYLLKFHELPANYISMDDAKDLGFNNKMDNMGDVAPEFTIGGGYFANREKLLPDEFGRTWYECDVDTVNGKRGKHRLVYSSDGLVYLTRDKYKSFVQVEGK
jgi:guanyl-specific ribonuclease Sa